MTLFSCVSPNTHRTLPRPHSSQAAYTPRAGQSSSPASRPSLQSHSYSAPSHAGPPFEDYLSLAHAQNLSEKNRAKLQKKPRVFKSMIGVPTAFVHCSHLDHEGAKDARSSKALAESIAGLNDTEPFIVKTVSDKEIPLRIRLSKPPEAARPVSLEPTLREEETSLPLPTVAKRKAPPPITPSIIRAVGLPSINSPPIALSTDYQRPAIVERKMRSPLTIRPHSGDVLHITGTPQTLCVPDIPQRQNQSPVGKENLLPPTVSTIRRDIEKLLDGPIDGMPAVETRPAMAAPMDPTRNLSNLTPSGVNNSNTIKSLHLSPSMEDLVQQAVIIDAASQPGGSHLATATN